MQTMDEELSDVNVFGNLMLHVLYTVDYIPFEIICLYFDDLHIHTHTPAHAHTHTHTITNT